MSECEAVNGKPMDIADHIFEPQNQEIDPAVDMTPDDMPEDLKGFFGLVLNGYTKHRAAQMMSKKWKSIEWRYGHWIKNNLESFDLA